MSETTKSKQKSEKHKKIEKNMMCFTGVAAGLGFCLAVGCTKMIFPTYVLTGYGIILIIVGLVVMLFDDKLKNKLRGNYNEKNNKQF